MESSLRDLKQKSALRKIPKDEWQDTIAQDNLASLQAMQRGELPKYDLSPKYGLEERDLGFNEELGAQIFDDPDYQRAASGTAEWLPFLGDIQAVEDASYVADAAKRNWHEGDYLSSVALGAGAEGLAVLAALGGATNIAPLLDPAVTAAQRGAGRSMREIADQMLNDLANRSVMDDLVPAGVPMRQLPPSQSDDLGGEVLMSESRGALDRLGRQVYDEPLNMPSQATDLDAQGFYSPTRRAASRIQEKGTGAQMKAQLLKSGLSGERIAEEMQDIGLDKWLDSKGKVTRQEIVDYVDANRVGYDEIRLGESDLPETLGEVDGLEVNYNDFFGNEWNYQAPTGDANTKRNVASITKTNDGKYNTKIYVSAGNTKEHYGFDTLEDAKENIEKTKTTSLKDLVTGENPTRHQSYALEGGENYRENLMTLPTRYDELSAERQSLASRILGEDLGDGSGRTVSDRIDEIDREIDEKIANSYQTPPSHYSQPNIALTTRTQSFKTNDGQSVHLIDELQSDWHDEGRKEGYGGGPNPKYAEWEAKKVKLEQELAQAKNDFADVYQPLTDLPDNLDDIPPLSDVENALMIKQQRIEEQIYAHNNQRPSPILRGVPDAPAKTAWKQQGLRRELTRAIQQGDDYIALTGGLEQAERYGLRKKVESVLYKQNADGTFRVSAQMPFGQPAKLIGQNISLDELGGIVGKEIAEKISDGSGVKRNLGGNFVSTPPDEWLELSGGDLEIGTEGKKKLYDKDFLGKLTKDVKRLDPNAKVEVIELNNGKKVWGIKITDTMRGKVKNSGMSLYSAAPVGAVGALGAIGASKENNEGI